MANFQIDPNKLIDKKNALVDEERRKAYQVEADPLFFKAQRGEIELSVWESKIQEIRERFPKI